MAQQATDQSGDDAPPKAGSQPKARTPTIFNRSLLVRIAVALVALLGLAACASSSGTATPGASSTATDTTTTSNTPLSGADAKGPRLTFKEKSHDFGKIDRNNAPEYRFAFTNTGKAPLQIRDVNAEPLDPST